jgi:hypothetical protein
VVDLVDIDVSADALDKGRNSCQGPALRPWDGWWGNTWPLIGVDTNSFFSLPFLPLSISLLLSLFSSVFFSFSTATSLLLSSSCLEGGFFSKERGRVSDRLRTCSANVRTEVRPTEMPGADGVLQLSAPVQSSSTPKLWARVFSMQMIWQPNRLQIQVVIELTDRKRARRRFH